MTTYTVDYSYTVEEFDSTVVEADDEEQAEMFALEYVRETYPERIQITIDKVTRI